MRPPLKDYLAQWMILAGILGHMTRKTKRILITTETHELLVIHRPGSQNLRGFCEHCQEQVEFFAVITTTTSSDPSPNLSKPLHVITTEYGQILICRNSLTKLFDEEQGEL